MNKEQLEELWEDATGLPDAKESPLAIAIIAEAMCDEDSCSPQQAARKLHTIAADCEDFATAIVEWVQGEPA